MSTKRTAVSCRAGSATACLLGREESFEHTGRGRGPAGACKCRGDPLGARSQLDRAAHRFPEAIRRQLACREPHAGACDLHAAGDLRLVATEGNSDDRDAVGERLLGDPHAGVADDAGRPLEQRRVREEALDADVRRRR